eukprot:921894-Rhodomonas_salina.1
MGTVVPGGTLERGLHPGLPQGADPPTLCSYTYGGTAICTDAWILLYQELAEGDEYLRSIWARVLPRVTLAMKVVPTAAVTFCYFPLLQFYCLCCRNQLHPLSNSAVSLSKVCCICRQTFCCICYQTLLRLLSDSPLSAIRLSSVCRHHTCTTPYHNATSAGLSPRCLSNVCGTPQFLHSAPPGLTAGPGDVRCAMCDVRCAMCDVR